MRIHIGIDPTTARRDVGGGGGELGVAIYFDHDGAQYPHHNWNDFGVRLLGFWLQQILEMRGGELRNPVFVFLDGDFELQGRVDDHGGIELRPTHVPEPFVWRVTTAELERAIVSAAEEIVSELRSLSLSPGGLEGVEVGLRKIRDVA